MLALTHLSDYGIDPSALPVHPDVTTFDSPANHVVGTGTALDGVVELVIDDQNLCTGALLTTRRHILTAAHCIDSATEVDVNFHLAAGLQTLEAEDHNLFVHPDFDIDNLGDGADIGLIALDEEAPAGVASFGIRRAALTQVSVVDVVGYGVAGQGIEQFLDGNKRDGLNRYELFFDTAQTMIMYDFDNGNSANDAIGIATEGGLANTGLGNDEVLGVGGDSGSPTFLNGVIAGVHSFRTTLQDGEGDAVAGLNGSFGEISVDGLTSAFADWIDSIDDTEGPQVTSVIVGSTEGTSDPDYTVPVGDGDQIQTVPVKRADEFSVVFDKDVSIQEADISLVNVDTGNPFSVSGFEYDRSTFTAKITLDDQLLVPYQVVLTIDGQSAGDVSDIAGNLLDGEWNNPTSLTQGSSDTFPSGNGTPGGTFELFLTIMPGNPSLDNVIDQDDLDPVLLNWGMSSATFQQGDTGGGAAIDQADLDNVLLRWGVDFTQWPGGEFLMMGGGEGSNRLDALHALDAALSRLGMHDKTTERVLTERRMDEAASDERAWDALISDIAAALDD